MSLSSGWSVKRYSTYLHRRLTSRVTVYRFERDDLEVRKKTRPEFKLPIWCLLHKGKDTGHVFKTAAEAIEYADDARIHGH